MVRAIGTYTAVHCDKEQGVLFRPHRKFNMMYALACVLLDAKI